MSVCGAVWCVDNECSISPPPPAPPLSPHLLHDDEEDVKDDVDEEEDEGHDVGHGEGAGVARGAQLVGRVHDGVAVPEAEERGERPGGGLVGGWCGVSDWSSTKRFFFSFLPSPGEGAKAREVGAEYRDAQQREADEDGHDLHEHARHAGHALVDDEDDGVLCVFCLFLYLNGLRKHGRRVDWGRQGGAVDWYWWESAPGTHQLVRVVEVAAGGDPEQGRPQAPQRCLTVGDHGRALVMVMIVVTVMFACMGQSRLCMYG